MTRGGEVIYPDTTLRQAAQQMRGLEDGPLPVCDSEHLVGMLTDRDITVRAIDFQKTLHIDAPIERVFQIWADYRNFPRFMSHVKEVHDLGDGRSNWRASEHTGGMGRRHQRLHSARDAGVAD